VFSLIGWVRGISEVYGSANCWVDFGASVMLSLGVA